MLFIFVFFLEFPNFYSSIIRVVNFKGMFGFLLEDQVNFFFFNKKKKITNTSPKRFNNTNNFLNQNYKPFYLLISLFSFVPLTFIFIKLSTL